MLKFKKVGDRLEITKEIINSVDKEQIIDAIKTTKEKIIELEEMLKEIDKK